MLELREIKKQIMIKHKINKQITITISEKRNFFLDGIKNSNDFNEIQKRKIYKMVEKLSDEQFEIFLKEVISNYNNFKEVVDFEIKLDELEDSFKKIDENIEKLDKQEKELRQKKEQIENEKEKEFLKNNLF